MSAMCIFMCMCTCSADADVCMCISRVHMGAKCVCVCTQMHVWRQGKTGCQASSLLTLYLVCFFETRSLLDLEFTDSTERLDKELQRPTQSPPTRSSMDPPNPRPQEAQGSTQSLPTGISRDPPKSPPTGSSRDPPSLLWGGGEPTQSPPTGNSGDPPSLCPHCCCVSLCPSF